MLREPYTPMRPISLRLTSVKMRDLEKPMTRPLTSLDFPLVAMGNMVYRKTESSPMIVAPDDQIAAELARRLNRDDQCHPSGPGWNEIVHERR